MRLPSLPYGVLDRRWSLDDQESAFRYGTSVIRDVTRILSPRSGTTCEPGNNSAICQKPTDSNNTQTLPIVLGVVIPVSCAFIVFVFLHRRNKKRQALEDVNDPHKSLDFGLDMSAPPPTAGKKKRGKHGPPEMIITDFDPRQFSKTRGLSMDMLGSPYMLPPGLAGSRESLHSMSRSTRDENDPYRPVTFVRTSGETSRSARPFNENGSMYSASTSHTGWNDKSSLVVNAQRVSQSIPEPAAVLYRTETKSSQGTSSPLPPLPNSSRSDPSSRKASLSHSDIKLPSITHEDFDFSPDRSPSGGAEEEGQAFSFPAELPATPMPESANSVTLPPRKSSAAAGPHISIARPASESSYYGDEQYDEPPPPPSKDMELYEQVYDLPQYDVDPNMIYTGRYSIDTPAPSQQYPVQDNRMSYMGLRPLPPDHPEENPEQRANRIRSFYKEYFDANRPHPANAYYEDFDANYTDYYYADDGWYDPDTGEYYEAAPQPQYAQPMGRRAMTPPPRGAPRFAGGHDRHYSTMSGGRAAFRGRAPPKKKLPPPKALTSLPTPHLLKEDSALFDAADFAPPTSFREQQNGRRPDSPMGIQRPFSPNVRAYSPLVSSFDGLSALPSPHMLRKSATFTSLDFTPQVPRFRGHETSGSDAGSIRSARSGISAMQMDAVRSGAYRVSRIPKEFVTSKEDLSKQLRPKMDLISPA